MKCYKSFQFPKKEKAHLTKEFRFKIFYPDDNHVFDNVTDY